MEFHFKSEVAAVDLWKLSMYHMYHSVVGVCNVIFTVAAVLLTMKLWNPAEGILMAFLIPACLLFPVIQPALIYLRAVGQVSGLPKNLELELNEYGLHVRSENQTSDIPWNKVKKVLKEPGMLILSVDAGRGYMLTDKVLGTQKADFLTFVESKMAVKK